jgi:hypothetical protein
MSPHFERSMDTDVVALAAIAKVYFDAAYAMDATLYD